MQETSKIKIDFSKGTYIILVTSTKKIIHKLPMQLLVPVKLRTLYNLKVYFQNQKNVSTSKTNEILDPQPPKKQLRIDEVLRSTRADNAANNEIVNFVAENKTHKNSAGNVT